MFLEIEAHPYIFRSLSTLVGSDPENSIDADNNMFPAGTCFNIGWLSHFIVDKQLDIPVSQTNDVGGYGGRFTTASLTRLE